MIPNHVLNDLTPGDRVAVLSRNGEIHFLVHAAAAEPAALQEYAAREGSEILAAHLRDQTEIQAFVASRERDVGGEG